MNPHVRSALGMAAVAAWLLGQAISPWGATLHAAQAPAKPKAKTQPKPKPKPKPKKPKPKPKMQIITTDKLHRGMKGYGLTVFEGAKIERFNVEVIDVMKNWSAKGDMILVRMSGGPLAKTGIIAGMSGSPVYFGGKLAGAVAYGWTFTKDAIAGVTPAEEMLEALKPAPKGDLAKTAWRGEPGLGRGWVADATMPGYDLAAALGLGWAESARGRMTELAPVQTPLMISGFSRETVKLLSAKLEPFGLLPVQTGGRGKARGPTPQAQPGCALGIELVKGDLDVSAIGTLTWRDGDKVLAFGHPMFGSGTTNLPIAVAAVHTVMASQMRSFKMASPVATVGRLTADRQSAVGGVLGKPPAMVPCSVAIDGLRQLRYHFDVAQDKRLTPALIEVALTEALFATERFRGEAMVRLQLQINIDKRREPIVLENLYYSSASPAQALFGATSRLYRLVQNRFEPVRITKARARVSVREGRQTAEIAGVTLDSKTVRPGESARLAVVLRPFAGPAVVKRIEAPIPKDVRPGMRVSIIVCDARTSQRLDRMAAPGKYRARNLDQLLRILREQEPNTALFVRTILPKMGVTIRGEPHPDLPASVLSAVAFSNATGIAPMCEIRTQRIPTKWVLSGSQQAQIVVEKETVR